MIQAPNKPKFGIAAVLAEGDWPKDILQWTAYWKKPTDDDFFALYEEYAEDEELGLVGVDIELIELDTNFVAELVEDIDFPNEPS